MDPIVETRAGSLRGKTDDNGVHAFLGVPYGTARRFQPAVAPLPWTGVRDALEIGNVSPQLVAGLGPTGLKAIGEASRGAEDCLVLNLWTAGIDNAKRPVMVWLHGGGFHMGSGSSVGGSSSGRVIARTQDIVSVTLNHRLGVLGYLDVSEVLGVGYEQSGLVGQLDIVLALQWVRDNIADFGGDPDNVTIYGESGGGMKVSALMAMPDARGLFHRAIIQSGPGVRLVEKESAFELTDVLLETLGLTPRTAQGLLELTAQDLLVAVAKGEGSRSGERALGARGSRAGLGPVVGTPGLPQHPFDPVPSPLSVDIPLIVGTTHHEAAYTMRGRDVDQQELELRMKGVFGERAEEFLDAYKTAYPEASTKDLAILSSTDIARYGSGVILERQAKASTAGTWCYVFSARNSEGYAPHGLEIAFHFETLGQNINAGNRESGLDLVAMGLIADDNSANRSISATMSGAWASFARTGKPGVDAVGWPEYTPEGRETLYFADVPYVAPDMPPALRELWDSRNFYG